MTFFRRPLLPCLLAYVLGLWLVHDLGHQWPVAAVLLAVMVAALCFVHAHRYRDFTALLLLGIMLAGTAVMGVRAYHAERAAVIIDQLDGPTPRMIAGEVASASNTSDVDRSRVVLERVRVTSGTDILVLPGRVQVNLEKSELSEQRLPATGERMAFMGRIYKPRFLSNFFGYNRSEALRHDGVYAAANPLGLNRSVRIDARASGTWGVAERALLLFRQNIKDILQKNMWPQEGRLMVAMLFNDMRALNWTEMQVFRESGTLHLFAVSGMHVAILGWGIMLLLRTLRFGVRGAWIGVCLTLFAYLWIIDFVPSATRAYLMLTAYTAGHVLRRDVDALTSLIFAAAVVILYDPAAPWDPGFILSVLGVLGIVLFTPLMKHWFWRESRADDGLAVRAFSWGLDILLATISVAIMLFPVQAYMFGFWNAMTIPANVVQGFLALGVLGTGVLTAAAGLVWEPAAQACGQTASVLMWLTYNISVLAADCYWALFYFRQLPTALLYAAYAILFSGYYMAYHDTPEFRLKSRARFATHAMCGLGLLVGFQITAGLGPKDLEIWAFDVGQGDATLVRMPSGDNILIDGGRSEPNMGAIVVAPQLRAMGIEMLDYIIATHDDEDHTGGLAEVIRRVGARHLLVPAGFAAKSKSSAEMLEVARRHGCIVTELSEGILAQAGECSITVLNPPAQVDPNRPDNESSIVLEIKYKQFSALLMGDAGLPAESRILNRWVTAGYFLPGRGRNDARVTLLKLGHHGSKTASGQEFIDAVRPLCALASCGANNNFGHPAAEVQARLEAAKTRLLRTDKQGAIRIITDGEQVAVVCCRKK